MKWRDFKTDPPYDAKEDEEAGFETDRVRAWFIWRHTHRPDKAPNHKHLSYTACEFFDGVFTEYKSHMRTSPYPCDWIEVLYWVDQDDVQKMIERDFYADHR